MQASSGVEVRERLKSSPRHRDNIAWPALQEHWIPRGQGPATLCKTTAVTPAGQVCRLVS